MKKPKDILIVGAGPSGLALSLFLSELGYHPTIIDQKTNIGPHSKALGVNPRTLQLLQQSGLTKKFLENGRKMEAINIWKENRLIYKNDLTKVNHQFPFMLIQGQRESEEILLEALRKRNIQVHYETSFQSFKREGKQFVVDLGQNSKFNNHFDYLIGADGGRSKVRDQMGVDLKGFSYEEDWELFDIELDTPLENDEGHIIVYPEGGMIMIRLKDKYWRIAGNMKSILNYLPKGTTTGSIKWESKFKIHNKIAKQLVVGNACLIGDAAHMHAPVGARGMNLGIEDAFIISKLIHEDTLVEYQSMRYPYLERTVSRINNMTIGLAGKNRGSRLLRSNLSYMRIFFPFLMPSIRRFILGLNT